MLTFCPNLSQLKLRYICENCSYATDSKKDYKKHVKTLKHMKNTSSNTMLTDLSQQIPAYECNICSKEYQSRAGLWSHKKKCNKEYNQTNNMNNSTKNNPNYSTDIILELIKQNQEFKDLLVEQNKQVHEAQCKSQETQLDMQQKMIELASENRVVNNTVNNNNKFNLNFFLNEKCKNAMDLTDFLNTIEVRVEDVTNMGRLGFAEGISRIFMKALNDLDVCERPIHCSDVKREMMYIKDNGIWEKDSDMKHHMKRAIKRISFKNIRKLSDWRDANPGWTVLHSQLEEDYLHITSESMGGASTDEDEKLYNKIIRKVANEVVIDKNSY